MDHQCLSKTWRQRIVMLVLSVIVIGVVFPVPVIGQDKCNRWWSQWFDTSPTPHFDTPQITCLTIESLYNQAHPNSRSRFTPEQVNDDLWRCLRDGQLYTDMHRAVRDDCCEATVIGNYTKYFLDSWTMNIPAPNGTIFKLTERPARGQDFRESQQKAKIRQRNKTNNGGQIMKSDLWDIPELADIDYPCNGQLVQNDPSNDCAPQIHHIVPRIDSKGCACGKNSFKNAVVITRKLNQELSNNCNDERLNRIIAYFDLVNSPFIPYSTKRKVPRKPIPSRKRPVKPRSN